MSKLIYEWLLRLYPPEFRQEFGKEAQFLFRDRLRNEQGFFLRSRLWLDVVVDLCRSLAHEHSRGELTSLVHTRGLYFELGSNSPGSGALCIGAVLSLAVVLVFPWLIGPPAIASGETSASYTSRFPGFGKLGMAIVPQLPAILTDSGSVDASRLQQVSFGPGQLAFFQGAPSKTPPEFEVASIYPIPAGRGGPSIVVSPGGRLTAENVTLKRLIRWAYQIQDFQISGGPDWIDSDKFEVIAKGNSDSTHAELSQMLQKLLEDRFKLKLGRQTKQLPVYALEIGNGGPKLKPIEQGGDGPSRVAMKPCARELTFPAGARIAQLANFLSSQSWMDRPIVDRTALDGIFDLKLRWTPDGPISLVDGGFEGGAPPPAPPPTSDAPCSGASLAKALQEQLGLKLVASQAAIEIFRVDYAEKLSKNSALDVKYIPGFQNTAASKNLGECLSSNSLSKPSLGCASLMSLQRFVKEKGRSR